MNTEDMEYLVLVVNQLDGLAAEVMRNSVILERGSSRWLFLIDGAFSELLDADRKAEISYALQSIVGGPIIVNFEVTQ